MVITGIQRQRAAVASGATLNCAWPSCLALLPIDAQRAETSPVTSLWSVARAKSRDAGRSGLRPEPGCARGAFGAAICRGLHTGDPQDRAMLDGPEHLSQFRCSIRKIENFQATDVNIKTLECRK
jgi:hypothetical protein